MAPRGRHRILVWASSFQQLKSEMSISLITEQSTQAKTDEVIETQRISRLCQARTACLGEVRIRFQLSTNGPMVLLDSASTECTPVQRFFRKNQFYLLNRLKKYT